MPEEIQIDHDKIQAIVSFLSQRMLALPSYNTEKSKIEAEIIELDSFSRTKTITDEQRDFHNGVLQSLQVPDDLLF